MTRGGCAQPALAAGQHHSTQPLYQGKCFLLHTRNSRVGFLLNQEALQLFGAALASVA